jgi:hypothetical protein
MKKPIVYAVGLALTLAGAGILGFESQSAAQDQTQPNAAQPAPAPPNPAPADQNQNPAPTNAPDQNQAAPANPAPANPAPANPAPPDQLQNPAPANPAPVNPAPATPLDQNQAAPNPAAASPNAPNQNQSSVTPGNTGQPGAPATPAAAPVYSSSLQQFASQQEDEVGMLSQQIDLFRTAKQPQAVMALYHMIRDHQLVVDAARNVLARRGDLATLSLNPMPLPSTDPQALYQADIQAHQQTIDQLQQMVANTSSPAEKNIYQQALTAANRHVQWLQALNQGQNLQIGFFGPTVPLDRIAGYRAELNNTAVNGYPQPRVQQAASRQNGSYGRRAARRYRGTRRYRARSTQQNSY